MARTPGGGSSLQIRGPETTPLVDDLSGRGRAMAADGRWADAERTFLKVVRLSPTPEAFHDLGVARLRGGKIQEAAQAHWNALVRAPGESRYALAFGELFRQLRFETFDAALEDMAVRCLTHPDLNPFAYRSVAGSIAACHPVLGPLLGTDDRVEGEGLAALSTQGLFVALLENAVPPSLAFEDLVRRVRASLLEEALAGGEQESRLALAVAVALQGHLTGYVALPWGAGEPESVERLCALVLRDLADGAPITDRPLALRLSVLGAYRRLEGLPGLPAPDLEFEDSGSLMARLWLRLVVEPALRASLAEEVPCHSAPSGDITRAVARQYEDHPYPRWLRHDRAEASPARDAVVGAAWGFPDHLTLSPGFGAAGRPRVLIAGCGTGKQALDAARRYRDAEILALDLSRASLGYAACAALQAGEESVAFLQADIMALDEWEQEFDIIESGGVLHHLADFEAGWRVLRDRLRPGGLMRVAVYSRLARQPLDRARHALARKGFDDSPTSIRKGRRWLVSTLSPDDLEVVAAWRDFYSLDECRDLLFHAHERSFDLGELSTAIDNLDLRFLGFEGLGEGTRAGFLSRYPEARRLDLSAWAALEEDSPRTFSGMYHFWVG
ncbi:MAG: methyltransferase domain-containing protein, partial [Gemmatimonadota bacterium]|nr:methyltransferase domain-containing protein [Gemmatimonadota bacterium]